MALDYFYSNKRKGQKDKTGVVPTTPPIMSEKKEPITRQVVIDYKRLTWVILIFAFLLLVWWLLASKYFIVEEIIYEQEPSPIIKEKIEGLRGKNILLLQLGQMEQEWQVQQPIIKTLHIYRGLPHTLRVAIEERSKAIVWKSNDHYYLLDASGVAYEDTGMDLKENFLPILDDGNVPVDLGKKIVGGDFVASVQELMDNVPSKIGDETIREMHVGESTFNVSILTSKDITIKFDITQPLDLQLEALDYIYKEKRGDVKEYVDVRVIGKAYIK